MAAEFKIAIDLSELMPPNVPITRASFPNLAMAVQMVIDDAQATWVNYAKGAPLPNGKQIEVRSGTYHRSIMQRTTGDFSGEVYSDLSYARAIEEGSPQYDMKKALTSSIRVRTTKSGKRYLIIPFRWGVPNSITIGQNIPEKVHNWWQQGRQPSMVTGASSRTSGTGALDIKTRQPLRTPAWTYQWGTRLGKAHLEALGVTGKAAQRMRGMVNFRKPKEGGGFHVGGAAHSKYITFRVMMEGSPRRA